MGAIHLLPVAGIGEIKAGDDLAGLCVEAFADFRDNDILVVSSKVVSKAEGNVVPESSLSLCPLPSIWPQLTGSSPNTVSWCCGKAQGFCGWQKEWSSAVPTTALLWPMQGWMPQHRRGGLADSPAQRP